MSFGELIEHLIIGGEETWLIADADGYMKIIEEFSRKKHENKVSDCRASCTMQQTGIAGGSNSPTAFVIKGKQKPGYTDNMLKENSAEHGSTVVMTENAFMTEETWLALTPKVIKEYQKIPFICDNPQWHGIDIFDGFGTHLCNHDSFQMRLDANLISMKEERNLFSINQAYGKQVARSRKMVQRKSFSYL